MEVIRVKNGRMGQRGFEPPSFVIADNYNDWITILFRDNPNEAMDDLVRQIPHIRRMNRARRSDCLESAGGKG